MKNSYQKKKKIWYEEQQRFVGKNHLDFFYLVYGFG
jgi:hypothetical protein